MSICITIVAHDVLNVFHTCPWLQQEGIPKHIYWAQSRRGWVVKNKAADGKWKVVALMHLKSSETKELACTIASSVGRSRRVVAFWLSHIRLMIGRA